MKKKRVNPRRKPVTAADINRAKKKAQNDAIDLCTSIIFTALLDGGFLDPENVPAAWDKVNYLSDSIVKGYVNAHDLKKVLQEEYDILMS